MSNQFYLTPTEYRHTANPNEIIGFYSIQEGKHLPPLEMYNVNFFFFFASGILKLDTQNILQMSS